MISTAQKHLDAVKSGTVTKSNIIGIRKAINHVERISAGWSANRSNVTPDEVFAIEEAIDASAPRVTGELHDSGLKVLRNPRYAKTFNADQRCIIEDAGARFELVEFERIGRRGEYGSPVYRIVDSKGRSFRFRNIPWQSGGNGPEVVQ